MKILRFSECSELSAIRETLFYTEFRPYIQERLGGKEGVSGLYIYENDEGKLSVKERYFAKMDILFGELFKNVNIRQFWKYSLRKLVNDEEISCLSIESLEKAYLNELVVLFERLGSILVLLKKALMNDIEVDDLEVKLLEFFNPMLFEKRNYGHHCVYLGFSGRIELKSLEEQVNDQESFEKYYEHFRKVISERITWINYTEKEMAEFLKTFLELVHSRIRKDGKYLEPKHIPSNFSCNDNLNVNLRRRYNHTKLYEEKQP